MRLSPFAAKSAASLSSRCVQTTLRPSPYFYPTSVFGTNINTRQYAALAGSASGNEKKHVIQKEQRFAAIKALEADIENNPTRVLNEEERNLRHDYRHYRFANLMRTVPNPVAIVTTRRQDIDDPAEHLIGATISSFKTVSMKPEPYISFNLAQGSRTHEVIKQHKYFCITIPQNDSAGAKLAKVFSWTGKSIAEVLKSENDNIQINQHYWKLALETGRVPGMKYPPPAVTASYVKGAKTNGLAFAFLCEYYDSINVGDHVLITGRVLPASITSASPWGRDDELGDSFSTSYLTLAYVHGLFGNPELIGGLDQSWKQDDEWANQSVRDIPSTQWKAALRFYEQRLQIIEQVQKSRNGPITTSDPYPTKEHKRAKLLRPELLEKYRLYYQNRLVDLHKITKPSQHTEKDDPLTKIQQVIQPFTPVKSEDSKAQMKQEPGVARKSFLSLDQLEQEEKVYVARLHALNWVDAEQMEISDTEETGSPQISSDAQNQSVNQSTMTGEAAAQRKSNTERMGSIEYFQRRLEVTRQAIKLKKEALLHPSTPEMLLMKRPSSHERERMIQRYLGQKRKLPLNILISDYRQAQVEITETRLARIQCLYQQGQYDEEVLEKLEERLAHFEQRLDLLAEVISVKYDRTESSTFNEKTSGIVMKWENELARESVETSQTQDKVLILKEHQPARHGRLFKRLQLPQDENDGTVERQADDTENVLPFHVSTGSGDVRN